jgi:hypothetical protein
MSRQVQKEMFISVRLFKRMIVCRVGLEEKMSCAPPHEFSSAGCCRESLAQLSANI